MKKLLKIVLKTTVTFLVLIIVYILLAFIFSRITIEKEPAEKAWVSIFIKTNGVHTDIVVPIKSEIYDWSKEILFENTTSKSTNFNYLAMGWGDKGFYLETHNWEDLKASVAFKAAFGLSSTAIHTTFYKSINCNESCKKINITKEQYVRLIYFIQKSFQKNKEGHFIPIRTNQVYGTNDAFYESEGKYSLFYTCNTWANNALKESGQRCCFWTPFDTGIFLKYK